MNKSITLTKVQEGSKARGVGPAQGCLESLEKSQTNN